VPDLKVTHHGGPCGRLGNGEALKRRISQFISLLILHSSWGPEAKWLCNPVLSCHSCVLSWFACPIGVLTQFAGYHVFPFLAIGTVLLFGVLFGRLLCGWVCPFGLLQDLLHKIPSRKFALPNWMRYIKYAILAVMVLLLPYLLGGETMLSFCRICPAATIQASIPSMISEKFANAGTHAIVKLTIMAAVLALAVFSARGFCKAFCPIGAILAPLNLVSFWFIRMPEGACIACKECDTACPMQGQPSSRIEKGIPSNRFAECIVCHECQFGCPIHGKQGQESDRTMAERGTGSAERGIGRS